MHHQALSAHWPTNSKSVVMSTFFLARVAHLRRLASRRSSAQAVLSADERYLSQATDIGDLERRMRQVERGNAQDASTQLSMMSWGH